MNLVVLGPPGSGKGTQADLLCGKYNLRHIASGELLRNALADNDPNIEKIRAIVESGGLPNFRDFAYLVENELKKSQTGFVLDGTPRNLEQCELLDLLFMNLKIEISHVIYLRLSHEESIKRLLKRNEGRADDSLATIKHRMEVYDAETAPVIDFYRNKGLLMEIDGTPDIKTINCDILNKLQIHPKS